MSVRFHTAFHGGSGRLQFLDPDTRRVALTPAEGRGWKTWWCFELQGLEIGTLWEVEVGGGKWSTPERLFYRGGEEEIWHRSEPCQPGVHQDGSRVYRVKAISSTMRFAWGPPFLLEDADRMVREVVSTGRAKVLLLCRSREGHEIPALRVNGAEKGTKRLGIWIMARQHAWESGGSWVTYGFSQWLVSGDPMAEELRARSEVVIIPIMDVDNVERGASGKDQPPQDYNRDWGGTEPHWPEVAAARQAILHMEGTTGLHLFIDLHQPGPSSKDSYLYVTPHEELTPDAQRILKRFLYHLQASMTGPLPFVGRTESRSVGSTGRGWVQKQMGSGVALTLEVPWNSPESTPGNYLHVGRQLGVAMAAFARGHVMDEILGVPFSKCVPTRDTE